MCVSKIHLFTLRFKLNRYLPRIFHVILYIYHILLNIWIKRNFSVSKKSDKNLMTVGNLAVCFGPTLLRPEEETVASIMDIKFYNIVVEILIENCERIIAGPPQDSSRVVQATVIPNKSQCVKMEEGPTSSGNGTAFLRYPRHTAVAVTPATSSHAHVSFDYLTYCSSYLIYTNNLILYLCMYTACYKILL